MDANQAFINAGATPFTVSYVNNKITITAAGAIEIAYFYENTTVGVNRHSTAGVVIGFMSNMAYANSIESDTVVAMLGEKVVLDSASANVATSIVINELNPAWFFDIDQALSFDIDAVALTIGGNIIYKETD